MYGETRHQSADGMERKEKVILKKTTNIINTHTLPLWKEKDGGESGDAPNAAKTNCAPPESLPFLCLSPPTTVAAVAALSLYAASSSFSRDYKEIKKGESTFTAEHPPVTISRRLLSLTSAPKNSSSLALAALRHLLLLQEDSISCTFVISNSDLIFIIGASSSALLRLFLSTHLDAICGIFDLDKAILRWKCWRLSRERKKCNHIARRMPSLVDSPTAEREERKKTLSSTYPLTFTIFRSIGASSPSSRSSLSSSPSSTSSSSSSSTSTSPLFTPYSVQSTLPFFLPIFPLFHLYSILPFLLLFFMVTVVLPQTSSALPPSINVGAVFTKDRIDHEIAFRLAIKRINVDRVILPHTQLVPKIEHIQAHDSFHGNKKGQFNNALFLILSHFAV